MNIEAELNRKVADLERMISVCKLDVRNISDTLVPQMAEQSAHLAEGNSFEKFVAHDIAVSRVAASAQAAYERLTEACAHVKDALTSFQEINKQLNKENFDEN